MPTVIAMHSENKKAKIHVSLFGKKRFFIHLETGIFMLATLVFFFTALTSLHLDLLNVMCPYAQGARRHLFLSRGGILQRLILIYGCGMVIVSLVSFILIRYRNRTLSAYCLTFARSLIQEVKAACKWFVRAGQLQQASIWLVLMMAMATAVRFFFFAQPMRYDEAYTFLHHVNCGFPEHFYYRYPNNHVLHTLLVCLSVKIFGCHPTIIRLPALFAGLLTIPLIFGLSRLLSGKRQSGILAATLTAVFPFLILFDTTARGYSMVVLLTLCLIVISTRVIDHPSIHLCSLMACIIALGLLVMPSFLFPAAGVFCWLTAVLIQRRRKPTWIFFHILLPCLVMMVVLTGIGYTPVIFVNDGIHSLTHNRFVVSLPMQEFLTRIPNHISSTASDFIRGIPVPLLVVSLILLATGFYATARDKYWHILLLLPAFLVGSAIIFFMKKAIPFSRTWIYVLPLIFIFMDVGLVALVRCPDVYYKLASLVLAGLAVISIIKQEMILSFPDTGFFPEAPVLADFLSREMNPSDRLFAWGAPEETMQFYMWYRGVSNKVNPEQRAADGRDFFVVKPTGLYSLEDVTDLETRRLLKIGDAELYVAE